MKFCHMHDIIDVGHLREIGPGTVKPRSPKNAPRKHLTPDVYPRERPYFVHSVPFGSLCAYKCAAAHTYFTYLVSFLPKKFRISSGFLFFPLKIRLWVPLKPPRKLLKVPKTAGKAPKTAEKASKSTYM